MTARIGAAPKLTGTDRQTIRLVLRDVIGHDAGITANDVLDLEAKLLKHGLAIVRVDAVVHEPGSPDHPATQIRSIVDG